MKTYFGFGLADSMLPTNCIVRKTQASAEWLKEFLAEGILTSCLNPSHLHTIQAMRSRYGLDVEIPVKAPQVSLSLGDSLVVMGVRGLPRLEGRHEYTKEEVDGATFVFSHYRVIEEG